jgi:hypothetical protein
MYENESLFSRRWMGMSVRQIGLLAGMAALNCAVLCVAVSLLAGPLGEAMGNTANTPTPAADTPTAEVITPTITRTPTVMKTPIGGWRVYSGNGMSITLPDSYIGGDPGSEATRIKKELSAAGLDTSKIENLFTQTPPYRFLAYGFPNGSSVHPFVLIASDPGNTASNLDAYINLILQMDADSFFFLDRSNAYLDHYVAVRYTVESKTNRTIREYQYFLQDENASYWVIAYTTTLASFADRIADFELSAMTFQALPTE